MRNKSRNFTLKFFASMIGLLLAVTLAQAHPINRAKTSIEEFFYQLKNTNVFVHRKLASNSSIDYKNLFAQIKNPNSHQLIHVEMDYLKYASGISNPNRVWQFKDTDLNQQIIQLFTTITSSDQQLGFQVALSRYDLFHGHLFAVYGADDTPQDVGILFHAKEYPRDLILGNPDAEKNSPFTTDSPGYIYRNFIWLASSHIIYDLDGDSSTIFPQYFLPEMLDTHDPEMKDVIRQYLKARTLIIDNLDVVTLGDVNCFMMNDEPVVFFTYY